MDIKKIIKDTFKDKEALEAFRYETSRAIFVFSLLIFFLNYFFVWAKFYDNYLIKILPFSYIFMIMCFCIFWYFSAVNFFAEKWNYKIFALIFFVIVFLGTIYPILWL